VADANARPPLLVVQDLDNDGRVQASGTSTGSSTTSAPA